jgi:glycerate kinase
MEKKRLAVMEMSEAAGMWRLQPNERDIEWTNTFGVGEMIMDATKRGAREIIVGLGGSATNDGGFGMARALGFRFLSKAENEIQKPVDLVLLERILPSPQSSPPGRGETKDQPGNEFASPSGRGNREAAGEGLLLPTIVAAADVRNLLLGENGATRVFGPQKGATPTNRETLERALTRLADVVAREFGFDYRNEPAAGAAGGLGFGLMSFCGAQVRSGFEIVAETIGFESKVQAADLVITGEGSLDRQTLAGKTAFGVAQIARRNGKRIVAVVGRVAGDRAANELFDDVYVIGDPEASERENIARAAELLRACGCKLAKAFNVSSV